jgi:hypothetical protein
MLDRRLSLKRRSFMQRMYGSGPTSLSSTAKGEGIAETVEAGIPNRGSTIGRSLKVMER